MSRTYIHLKGHPHNKQTAINHQWTTRQPNRNSNTLMSGATSKSRNSHKINIKSENLPYSCSLLFDCNTYTLYSCNLPHSAQTVVTKQSWKAFWICPLVELHTSFCELVQMLYTSNQFEPISSERFQTKTTFQTRLYI